MVRTGFGVVYEGWLRDGLRDELRVGVFLVFYGFDINA